MSGMNMEPTCKQINYWIKDEAKATAEYKKYGYPKLSKQEAGHRRFLIQQKRIKKCGA
jgi:hypothetical protein